jgi:tetratricopeptide (TPR) repeat protein
LLALVDKKQHRANYHLALHVGRLLYEHNRLAALRQLMERQCGLKPLDAGKFNLLGLALVREDPRRAIDQFQRALRCDLRFGPAYLNLALAYQAIDEPRSARQCLRRYLKLEPAGVCARDARRRLQELEAEEPN